MGTGMEPINKPENTTLLSSMRLDSSVAYTTYSGDKFLKYLKETLIPTLKPWDIVVMDNLRTHHIAEVRSKRFCANRKSGRRKL